MKVRLCVLGPLAVFLCAVSQTCRGTQAEPKTDPGPTSDQRSQQPTSRSRRGPWSRTSPESRSDSVDFYRPSSKNPPQNSQSLNSRLKLQPVEKYVANLRQQRNNGTKESSQSRSKSKFGSSVDIRNKNATSGPSQSSPSMTKNRPRLKSSPMAGPKVDAKVFKAEDASSQRAHRNLTKAADLDNKDSHKPKRGWVWNQFYVLEEHIGPEPQYVGKLHSNSDKGDGSVRYILSGEGAGSLFTINEDTGDIHSPRSLDRETKAQYVLHARAVDRVTNRSIETQSEFIIKVQDVNDNPPTFPHGPFSATVPEMSEVGTSVFQVTASDADDPTYGNSAKIVYSLLEGQPYFSVDPKSGVIRTAVSSLDRETRAHYSVLVQAKDMAGSVGGLSGSTTVNITLSDVNDNPPKFPQKSYQLYVTELTPVGKAVGRIQATDEDEGPNAEMTYSITNSEAAAVFDISTDPSRREGIVSLRQPLNHEKRKVHTVNIEVVNAQVDGRFSHLGAFRDTTSLQVIVGDVDEPPVFSMDFYILDVYENSPAGTQVGAVSARDPDTTNSAIRYFIEKEEGRPMFFTIGVNSGIIRTSQALDREETAWHNITVMAAEVDNPRMMTHVQVTIQVLDINDNIPSVAGGNSAIIACDNTKIGQVIQTIRAADRDNFANGKFSFRIPPEHQVNPNFTIRDNGDSSASVVSRRREGFSGLQDSFFSLVLVVSDGGEPPLSSTATLHVRVCVCERNSRGRYGANVCQAQAFLSSAGISTGAFVAILLCVVILLAIVTLFAQLRNKKSGKDQLILSEEDVRENVVAYDDEGGGEEDTEAFDITALRNPKASERYPKIRGYYDRSPYGEDTDEDEEEEEEETDEEDSDGGVVIVRRRGRRRKPPRDFDLDSCSPESEPSWFVVDCAPGDVSRSAPSLLSEGHDVVRQILHRKVALADCDTRGPPYDSLQTYAYEGRGSPAGSVSSLGLAAAAAFTELSYADLEDWEADRRVLERILGEEDITDS